MDLSHCLGLALRVHEQEARLAALGAGKEAKHRQRLQKLVRDLNRQLEGSLDTPHLDRVLGELGRILGSKVSYVAGRPVSLIT